MELCCIGVVALLAICCGMLGVATAANMSASEMPDSVTERQKDGERSTERDGIF
jgi:hypothetical protein